MDGVVERGGVLGFKFGCLTTTFPPEYATMSERSNSTLALPATTSRDVLTEILRDGAQQLLAQAVESEPRSPSGSRRGPM